MLGASISGLKEKDYYTMHWIIRNVLFLAKMRNCYSLHSTFDAPASGIKRIKTGYILRWAVLLLTEKKIIITSCILCLDNSITGSEDNGFLRTAFYVGRTLRGQMLLLLAETKTIVSDNILRGTILLLAEKKLVLLTKFCAGRFLY